MSEESRERAIDEHVRAALGTPRPAGVCPDEETLALYASQALAEDERAAVEPHLALCARCQDVLALLATTEEVVPLLGAAPSTAVVGRAVPHGAPRREARNVGSPPAATSTSWWHWRWFLPVPAAAMAAALYFAVRPAPPVTAPALEMAARETAAGSGSTAGAAAEPAAAEQPLVAAPTTPPGKDAGPPASTAWRRPAAAPAGKAKSDGADESRTRAEDVAARALPAAVMEARRDANQQPVATRQEAVAAPVTSTPAETAKATAGSDQSGVVAGAVPPAQPVTTGFAKGRAVGAPAGNVVLPTPEDARFRIDPSGRLSSTADAGRTWQLVKLSQPAILSTGHCATSTTARTVPCWIAGRNGVLFRTIDGTSWQRVPSPTTRDIVTITTASGDRAVLTTADGRRFETTDAGATWRER